MTAAAQTGTEWRPDVYARFAAERRRPFDDLMARAVAALGDDPPAVVVDLGSGTSVLTAALKRRWPAARVVGVDSSAPMVARADEARAAGVEVVEADLRTWRAGEPVDLLVTNAALQWVPGHLDLLAGMAARLAPGGVLAMQVPGNFAEPSHRILEETRAAPRWRERLARAAPPPWSAEPAAYLDVLASAGLDVDAWETTYLHLLPGDDPVLRWLEGTGLRPVLTALDDAGRAELLAELGPRLRAAYPRGPHGTVLPFRRVFAVGRDRRPRAAGPA